MRYVTAFARSVGILALLALFAGYLGQLHPLFDSVSVMRLHVLISLCVVTILLLLAQKWRSGLVFAGLVTAGVIAMIPYILMDDTKGGLKLLQSNLLFRNDASALVSYVQDAQPDILTLQEVTDQSLANLDRIRADYPHQVYCTFASVGGVAILTKFPPLEAGSGCREGDGLVWTRVMTPNGAVTIASIHLFWPYPHHQAEQIERLLPYLEGMPRPVLIGGDFNNVAWSHNIHRIERATGTRAISGIRLSFDVYKGWGRFPIDHVLVPDGKGSARLGANLGSDHKSIIAALDLRD